MWLVTTLLYSLLLVLFEGVIGDGHPNQGLLPEECGFIYGERMPDSKYAGLYEFPWMAGVFNFGKDGGRRFVCSGTVINQRYILIPGHCTWVLNQSPNKQVRVGDYDRQHDVDCEGQGPTLLCEDQFQDIGIEEVIVHANFNATVGVINDIGLLRLKTPIDFSPKNAAPICLPLTAELQAIMLPGKEAIIAGWELMVNGATTSKMLKLKLPIREFDECLTRLARASNSTTSGPNICTGGDEGVCPLQSGSPLMLPSAVKDRGFRYFQYGMSSFGTRFCDSKQWTSYTDISKYGDWILDNLKA